ncbi:MAG: hypothetical protein HY519_01730 [Candidatus Aenigmarchaeota archaeon]|nr:hypothetical protein [Candidatus Aenigmarchaeota archaeon]
MEMSYYGEGITWEALRRIAVRKRLEREESMEESMQRQKRLVDFYSV